MVSNAKSPSCFYPIPQAADCMTRIVEKANAPVIYLSTDAAESETGLLQSLLVVDGKVVPLVKRPPRNSAEKWDSLLYRHGIEDNSQVTNAIAIIPLETPLFPSSMTQTLSLSPSLSRIDLLGYWNV